MKTPAYEMHIREMYACDTYTHCSVTFLGIIAEYLTKSAI